MQHTDFLRVAAASPALTVAGGYQNAEAIISMIHSADESGVQVLVLPELALTGYTAGDLFFQPTLLDGVQECLSRVVRATQGSDMVTVLGCVVPDGNCIYNCAVFCQNGRILAVVPKHNLPNYGEFYELRHFAPGFEDVRTLRILDQDVPFGMNILLHADNEPSVVLAAEVCEDLWAPNPPSVSHALAGATVIVNPSASDELVGKSDYRRQLVSMHSARLVSGYVYANAGPGESTQDMVFSAHDMIAENGIVLNETPKYTDDMIVSDIDTQFLLFERRRMNTFREGTAPHARVSFTLRAPQQDSLYRYVDPMPFVPSQTHERDRRCEDILAIQVHGLMKRLSHTRSKCAVVGLSGGLDSTLALIVMARAFESLNLDKHGLIAVTMPCFGTTGRTYRNACALAAGVGARLMEVNIEKAVRQHFADIQHDDTILDVTYENCQARERTQVLMDIANQEGGLVIGTGDLSEMALGWATYNGDHMSMYAVNVSIPKTLIRHLVRYAADKTSDESLRGVLLDILDTPVSPELLPPKDGKIAQKTEEVVGPYELHDFFLYHLIRRGEPARKVFRLAQAAFPGTYTPEIIERWLRTFISRFFSQQFKRSCIPDGPKVGSVSLSPRADWRMPSDASRELWEL